VNALYLLGAGVPTPSKTRFGTSCVLDLAGELLMIDCGPAATAKLVRAGLWPTDIEHLFITHHHFDHMADYPCFVLVRWDQSIGKEKTLKVWGPPPMRLITERLFGKKGAFVFDWTARVNDPTSRHVFVNRGGTLPRPKPRIEAHDVKPGPVVRTPRWRASASRAEHMDPWLKTLSWRVDAKGLSIVFAADTEPCRALTDLASGCDVFVANCWDLQNTMDANGEAPGQTGTRDAATMARDAGARMLVLTHIGKRLAAPAGRRKGLREIRSIYKGEVVFGEESMKITL
jgi:ribonuclease BN (tRNA processing enzyme)